MAGKKTFKHDPKFDLFSTPEELSKAAVQAGLTPIDFVKRYFDGMQDATVWNTASQFIATILNVRAENTANNTLTAMIDYEIRTGTPDANQDSIRIGIISPTDPTQPLNLMASKAKALIGQKAKITRGYAYSRKDDCDYAILLDVESLSPQTSTPNAHSSQPQQRRTSHLDAYK